MNLLSVKFYVSRILQNCKFYHNNFKQCQKLEIQTNIKVLYHSCTEREIKHMNDK